MGGKSETGSMKTPLTAGTCLSCYTTSVIVCHKRLESSLVVPNYKYRRKHPHLHRVHCMPYFITSPSCNSVWLTLAVQNDSSVPGQFCLMVITATQNCWFKHSEVKKYIKWLVKVSMYKQISILNLIWIGKAGLSACSVDNSGLTCTFISRP